jgi:preprotein translocase subunit YajC
VGYLIVLVALVALMWLLLIRPQRRRQLQQAQMQDALEPGTEILTAGGIHGTVQSIEDEIVHVEIAPGTVIRLDRRAVAAVAQEPEPQAGTELEPQAEPESTAQSGES